MNKEQPPQPKVFLTLKESKNPCFGLLKKKLTFFSNVDVNLLFEFPDNFPQETMNFKIHLEHKKRLLDNHHLELGEKTKDSIQRLGTFPTSHKMHFSFIDIGSFKKSLKVMASMENDSGEVLKFISPEFCVKSKFHKETIPIDGRIQLSPYNDIFNQNEELKKNSFGSEHKRKLSQISSPSKKIKFNEVPFTKKSFQVPLNENLQDVHHSHFK
jgi:hypothetical protein